ncbi:hypothetical protein WNY51_00150 [Pseudocolwellia sp. AS88]
MQNVTKYFCKDNRGFSYLINIATIRQQSAFSNYLQNKMSPNIWQR